MRLDAVTLLTWVDCSQRREWLEARTADPDGVVRRAARRLLDTAAPDGIDVELLESDFAGGCHSTGWSWEYVVRVYDGPRRYSEQRVWVASEDDRIARQLAVVKAGRGGTIAGDPSDAYVISRRFVSEFTRSARSKREAERWAGEGGGTRRP